MENYRKRKLVTKKLKLVTARLNHNREISSDSRSDPKGESHDRESDGPTSFGCCPAHHSSEDHGDGQDIAVREESEVVVLDGQAPPNGLKHLEQGCSTFFKSWNL
jgi:hypothetical protein